MPELLVMGGAVALVSVVFLSTAEMRLMPSRDVAFNFSAVVRESWAGPLAIACARNGEPDRALQILESAQRRGYDMGRGRTLAVASHEVAIELGRQEYYPEAVRAWGLAIRFARDSGDVVLENQAREGIKAAAKAVANASTVAPR
ncbi:hypothetical protein [Enhygromyxa salina]|uniref:hypothetical protein n=1 Tax=Enhygromyxa salina TaxID=215803 RepID=UPI0011BA7744|nr:hypothetical protein [Enhygromyxa salina]